MSFGAPLWPWWNGNFFLVFTPFSWNSWIRISREFSIANFKSSQDYRSLDSIAWLSLDSIAWFFDREIKIPSIANITKSRRSRIQNFRPSWNSKIPLIAKIKKVPSIANTKKIRRSQVQKFPLIKNLAGHGKYRNPFFIFHTKSKFEFALTFWKKFEFLVGLFARRLRDGYLKIVT